MLIPASEKNRISGSLFVLALNVGLLLIACGILFYRHQNALFEDQDALLALLLVKLAFTWQPSLLAEAWNPMSLLGSNVLFNAYLMPPLIALHSGLSAFLAKILCFTVLAVELFLGMYALCRSFDVDQNKALAVAWVCVNLVLPLHQHPVPLGAVYTVWPPFGHAAALVMFTLASFRLVGRTTGRARDLLAAGGFVLFSTLQVITSVGLSPLSVPPTILGVCCLLLLSSRKELAWKAAAIAGVLLVMATGPLAWTVGKILYSARYWFHAEMITSPPLPYLVSSAFYGTLGPKLALGLTILGGVIMAGAPQRELRYIARTFLFYMLVHTLYGASYLSGRFDFRSLPHPIYLDYTTTPLFAVFFCYFFVFLFRMFTTRWPKAWTALHLYFTARSMPRPPQFLLIVAHIYFLLQGISTFAFKRYKTQPQLTSTSIVARLQPEIALQPGSDFRGRCSSLLMCGLVSDAEAAAGIQADCAGSKHLGWKPGLNNTHTLSSLWFFDVPTLDGYEQTLPSAFYVLYSRLASRSPWINNYTGISQLNIPLLTASGVRFIITPRPVSAPGVVPRQFIRLGPQGIVTQGPVASQEQLLTLADEGNTLCLYELPSPNLGQYSPEKVHLAQPLTAALDIMGKPGFDYSREVVLHEALPQGQKLSSAKLLAPLRLEKGGMRLHASSESTSVLLLPFEYSHSLTWIPDDKAGASVRIVRANVTMTALVFSGNIAGRLVYEFGPWTNAGARVRDLRDLQEMGLRDLPLRPVKGPARYIPI
jgi:hypothetical protein